VREVLIMGEEKIAVLETKVENMQGDIQELYKRSNDTNATINGLNVSIAKLTGSIEMFSLKLDSSIENLSTKLNDKIEQMSKDIDKISCKNDKADDREKKNTDRVRIAVIGGLIGIGLGAIAVFLGLK
jgi:prefoldin subunit 5